MAVKAFTAKVKIGSKVPNGAGVTSVSFYPNYGSNGAEINKEWAASTPGLSYQMSIKNELADRLNMGDEYTATFTLDDKESEVASDVSNSSA